MLKLPHKVKVGYREYTIQPMFPSEGGDTHLGLHYGNWGVITINYSANPNFPDKEIINTIIHELLHAVLSVQGHTFKNEEKVVDSIANGLMLLIEDNPHLFEWLIEQLCDDKSRARVPADGLQEPSRMECLPVPEEASFKTQLQDRLRNRSSEVCASKKVLPRLRAYLRGWAQDIYRGQRLLPWGRQD